MRLHAWTGAWTGAWRPLPVLVLLTVLQAKADQPQPKERHYYIAAVETDWSYHGDDRFGPTYKKVVFREYEKDFRQAKTHPSWLGLLGPTLRAEVGETIVVTFRNMASRPHSLHPHGVAYGKQSEGANYFDNTSLKEKEDDVVQPNGEHVYYWDITPDVAPQPNDPACLTHTYISHQNVVQDYNSGLIGTLLICKNGSLDESGKQADFQQEYVFLFGVFDETASNYRSISYESGSDVKYTINGYVEGSLPDVSFCAHASVSLHLVGMSSKPEVFSVHMNGQVLQQNGHKVSSVGLITGSSTSVSMVPVHQGRWLLSSFTMKHMEAGMHGFVDVKKCEGIEAPRRRMTIAEKRESKEWKYYIAAEEIVWDYAQGSHQHMDRTYTSQYLTRSSTRIGGKYKKAVFTMYTNESFTERLENNQRKNELGILGPVIRAQYRDVIKIVFKNLASRPYSIYPHGLTIEKSEEGANYPAGGNQSHGVEPGETYTYIWKVIKEDEPLDNDPQCLTRFYHSAVDTPRDIASGLIGPILICKSQSLNVRNIQLKADKEQHAVFAVFDENKSWYLDDNIRRRCDRTKVNKADPDFYKSNVMHSINGYVYDSGPLLGFCKDEVATWHVSSIGAQDYIQTATFYGHPFKLNERTEDYLSLYPMTGETISMDMDNTGVWLLASLNTHETTKGMRVKFRDVECFRDYQYEYEDVGDKQGFTVWNPLPLEEVKKEEVEPIPDDELPEIDIYTEMFVNQLGLRSSKNASSDMEQLDLSMFDYDVVDVPDGNTNTPLNFTKTAAKNKTSMPDTRNETLSPKGKDENGPKLTPSNMLIQSIGDIVAFLQKNTLSPFNNSSVYTAKNTTGSDPGMLLQNDSSTTNSSAPVSSLGNDTLSDAGNVTLQNVSTSVGGNVSGQITNITLTSQENSSSISETERLNGMLPRDKVTLEMDLSEEGFAREFSYSVPSLSSSTDNLQYPQGDNVTALSHSTEKDDKKNTSSTSAGATNHSLSIPNAGASGANKNSINNHDLTILELELLSTDNQSQDFLFAAVDPEYSLVKTEHSPNATVNISKSDRHNDTAAPEMNHEKELTSDSEKLSVSDIIEEVFIYLKENMTNVIKTTSVEPEGHNWTYGTHELVSGEFPDYLMKYFGKDIPQPTTPPKKTKMVRQWPQKGKGMKTKRRKEYKPQARSGLPFSPRGFNPGMTPRGSRPHIPEPLSDEEHLINMPVVIGVPRPDFSNYELYVPGDEPEHIGLDESDGKADEYEYVAYKDPYSSHEDIKNFNDGNTKFYLRYAGSNTRTYFIAAEEVEWDYAGYGHRRQDKLDDSGRETKFTKVVFRSYLDSSFTIPEIRGEIDEHLGILGPVIKAEVGQTIIVVFKNNANRPYSIHPNGVSYTKQTEGLSYEDESNSWYQYDNEVKPGKNFTYVWTVNSMVGPAPNQSHCRTWAYYSGVNPERDIHSGLIGPLLVCREGTLGKELLNMRYFTLMFMTFDESQSWYYEKNYELIQRKKRWKVMDPNFKENLKFHSINGIIYNLKGLRMYTDQLVCWHLINMGSPKDFQSVHFHGQTFLHKTTVSYRGAVYPLLPGSFATLEMYPSKPGLWQLETEIGFSQQKGMQTLFLVLQKDCNRPLGLESGSVKNITAINTRGYWKPDLARLNNQGKYNAWSTEQNSSWIQVDFERPVVISQVATQGAKQMFVSQYVVKYFISYSTDRRKWTFYKGDSADLRKVFTGNQDAHGTKHNTFFPPVIGRFIRLHPINWYNKATLRMEFYGCELDGCSVPLGMESGLIADHRITASSVASSWYWGTWSPALARLNKQGTVNAWKAKYNDANQWIQVELSHVKKITGIITQGAKTLGKQMYVISYILLYSDNGIHWNQYTDDEIEPYKTFYGNTDNNDHVKNYIYPPIFSRFIRIVPKSWMGSITMRIELLGCDFE
ncbi:uncharacterized protein V6R79_014032 [Siganus canaliculatus]